jgi:HEAT repeats
MRDRRSILLTFFLAAVVHGVARADVVEFKNGGQLHGKVTNADDKQAASYVVVTDGGGKVTIPRSEVVRVVSQSPAQEEYHRRARAVDDTINAHWQLAQWCREEKMADEYREQLTKILVLDPDYEPARRALGHQKQNGEWQSRDELMAARGMVWYDGKYYTPQHVELLKQAKEAKQTDADWKTQLDRWRRWLSSRRQEKVDEALREIRAIHDPAAAPAVVDLLMNEKNLAARRLLMEVAAGLDDPQVLEALVTLSLNDPNEDLRYSALEYLIDSGRPGLVAPYVRALRSNDNTIVNRAAAALEKIGNRDAIGPLIGALVTKHKTVVGKGPPDQQSIMFTPSGGTALNYGGGGAKVVSQAVENPAVLSALAKLSGVNFGFDQVAWRNWLAAQAKAHPVDVRRDQ